MNEKTHASGISARHGIRKGAGQRLGPSACLHIILKVVLTLVSGSAGGPTRTTTAVSATVWNPISGLRHRQSLRRPWRSKTSGLFASQQTIQWCVGELNTYSKRTMCPDRCGRLFHPKPLMRPTRLGGTMPGAKRDLAGFLVNPRVEIVGYLHDYSGIVPI